MTAFHVELPWLSGLLQIIRHANVRTNKERNCLVLSLSSSFSLFRDVCLRCRGPKSCVQRINTQNSAVAIKQGRWVVVWTPPWCCNGFVSSLRQSESCHNRKSNLALSSISPSGAGPPHYRRLQLAQSSIIPDCRTKSLGWILHHLETASSRHALCSTSRLSSKTATVELPSVWR